MDELDGTVKEKQNKPFCVWSK